MLFVLIKIFDLFFSILGLLISFPILLIVFLIGLFDTGSPIFIQERVGRNKRPFKLVKFRTMSINTASVATHMVTSASVTKFGSFLRKTKIDELPQLINVIKGDMSLVGPRPCLFNQETLIMERDKQGVFDVLPGITGLAQINQIDMSAPKCLADWDKKMIESFSISDYFKYILLTIIGRGSGDRVSKDK